MIGDYPMRKFEQQIHDVEIMKAILDRVEFVTIAANDGGYPYVVPTNFGYEFREGKLFVYIHGAGEGHKLDVWAADNRVTLTFAMFQNHPQHPYRGAIHDYRCLMANGTIRPVSRQTETGLWGRAVQLTLSHHMRRPTQFDVPHYMFMRMFVIECDMKNVSCKTEQAVYSPGDVPFPSEEEILSGGADKPDYSWRKAVVRKNHPAAPLGRAVKPAAVKELESEALPAGKSCLSFFWDAPEDGSVDADIYAYVRDADGTIARRYCLAFYNQLRDLSGAVEHRGDDMQGLAGTESVTVDAAGLPESAGEVLFVLAMHEPEKSGLDLASIGDVAVSCAPEGCRGSGADGAGSEGAPRAYSLRMDGHGKQAAVCARLVKKDGAWFLEKGDCSGLSSWRADDIGLELGMKQWRE